MLQISDLSPESTRVFVKHCKEIQSAVEECFKSYLNKTEVEKLLFTTEEKVFPCITELVWLKLDAENPDFFKAYNLMLVVKDQIVKFNELLLKQVEMTNPPGTEIIPHSFSSSESHFSPTQQTSTSHMKPQVVQYLRQPNMLNNSESFFQPHLQGNVRGPTPYGNMGFAQSPVVFRQFNMVPAQRMNPLCYAESSRFHISPPGSFPGSNSPVVFDNSPFGGFLGSKSPVVFNNSPLGSFPGLNSPAYFDNSPLGSFPESNSPACFNNSPLSSFPGSNSPASFDNSPYSSFVGSNSPACFDNSPLSSFPGSNSPASFNNSPYSSFVGSNYPIGGALMMQSRSNVNNSNVQHGKNSLHFRSKVNNSNVQHGNNTQHSRSNVNNSNLQHGKNTLQSRSNVNNSNEQHGNNTLSAGDALSSGNLSSFPPSFNYPVQQSVNDISGDQEEPIFGSIDEDNFMHPNGAVQKSEFDPAHKNWPYYK